MEFKNLFFGKGKLFGAKADSRQSPAPPASDEVEDIPANDRLENPGFFADADAWIFCATMQLRTPGWILAHHNEIYRGAFNTLPRYATAQWQGIWVPHAELSKLEAVLSQGRTMASEVGSIPADGGDYLHFLVAFRNISESGSPVEVLSDALRSLLTQHGPGGTPYSSFYTADALIDQVIPLVTASIPVNKTVQAGLQRAGYRTLREIGMASDEALLAINGLGEKALLTIRQFLSNTTLPVDAIRVLAPAFAA